MGSNDEHFICWWHGITHIQILNIQYTSTNSFCLSGFLLSYSICDDLINKDSDSINNPRISNFILYLISFSNGLCTLFIIHITHTHAHKLTCKHKMPMLDSPRFSSAGNASHLCLSIIIVATQQKQQKTDTFNGKYSVSHCLLYVWLDIFFRLWKKKL